MKVKAIYNNGKPWLTLYPENESEESIVKDLYSSDYRLYSGGIGWTGYKLDYVNITAKRKPKLLRQRIKEVFKP